MHAINGRVYFNSPVMQGLRVIKARVFEGLYNSRALHRRFIIANNGIRSIFYG